MKIYSDILEKVYLFDFEDTKQFEIEVTISVANRNDDLGLNLYAFAFAQSR